MWMFGKRSNQPAASELPPELRPFYGQQKVKNPRTSQLSAVIVLVVVVVAVVLLGLWLHGRTTNVQQAKATTHSSTETTKGSHSTQVSSSPKTVTTPTESSAPQSVASTNVMPNTGPGMNMFLVAATAGLLGAILYHLHQLRSTNKLSRIPEKRI